MAIAIFTTNVSASLITAENIEIPTTDSALTFTGFNTESDNWLNFDQLTSTSAFSAKRRIPTFESFGYKLASTSTLDNLLNVIIPNYNPVKLEQNGTSGELSTSKNSWNKIHQFQRLGAGSTLGDMTKSTLTFSLLSANNDGQTLSNTLIYLSQEAEEQTVYEERSIPFEESFAYMNVYQEQLDLIEQNEQACLEEGAPQAICEEFAWEEGYKFYDSKEKEYNKSPEMGTYPDWVVVDIASSIKIERQTMLSTCIKEECFNFNNAKTSLALVKAPEVAVAVNEPATLAIFSLSVFALVARRFSKNEQKAV